MWNTGGANPPPPASPQAVPPRPPHYSSPPPARPSALAATVGTPLDTAMLAADKDRLIFDIKQKALALRKMELEMIVSRYNNLAGLCSIAAGFSFDAIVELEFPEAEDEEDGPSPALKVMFYLSSSVALTLALYVVAVASFTVVNGHQLALLGSSSGAIDRAVAVMLKQHHTLFATSAGSMLSVIVAATTIAWIKMGHPWAHVTTLLFGGLLAAGGYKINMLRKQFRFDRMIHGDAYVDVHGGRGEQIDLARLHAQDGQVFQRTNSLWGSRDSLADDYKYGIYGSPGNSPNGGRSYGDEAFEYAQGSLPLEEEVMPGIPPNAPVPGARQMPLSPLPLSVSPQRARPPPASAPPWYSWRARKEEERSLGGGTATDYNRLAG